MSKEDLHGPVIAIVQGRMSSSRLPGKVLLDIGGQPMLARVVMRARRARTLDHVIVATTTDPSDEAIAEFCRERGFPCFRGDLFDVLDRYYQAARLYQAGVIVRLTADCPVLDPDEIDRTVKLLFETGAEFTTNRLPPPFKRTTPIGLDTEVCTFAALERAWREAKAKHEREHVMPYLYEDPGRFKMKVADMEPDCSHLRWTVDTPEDLEVMRQIYAAFQNDDGFSLAELLIMNKKHPEWQQMTSTVQHKTFMDVDEKADNGEQA